MTALLSTTYFGPVQWYQKLYRSEAAVIDVDETFVKQTFRNRCYIAAANGVQALTVPIERARLTRDVRISDHGDWRRVHWNAITSAYGESPFFEYYQDDLRPFYERRWEFLHDFNEAIRETVCSLIDIHPSLLPSSSPSPMPAPSSSPSPMPSPSASPSPMPAPCAGSMTDYRTAINPKHPAPDVDFQPRPYYQVYASRYGFQPNLSVLDLLLNMGPESIFYL
jgi:hypothetical protein